MGGDVLFQTPHLSQEQEIVQMVWVCSVLPSLNANTKNTQLECRTWQQGQVGGLGFVATLRAYFDTRGPSGRNLNPAPWFSSTLIFYFALGEFSGDTCRGSKSRWEGDLGALFLGSLGRVFWEFFFFVFRAALLSRLVAINTWYMYPGLDRTADQLVLASNFTSYSISFPLRWLLSF